MPTAPDLKREGDDRLRAGDPDGARDAYARAHAAAREAADDATTAAALQGLGRARLAAGDAERALHDLRRAFDAHLAARREPAAGACLGYMGQAATAAGDAARAAMLFEWALALHRALDDGFAEALDLEQQGAALWDLEATAAALGAWWLASRLHREAGHPAGERVEALLAGYAEDIGPELAESMIADLSRNAEERRRSGVAIAHQSTAGDRLLEDVGARLRDAFGVGAPDEAP